MVSVGNKIGVLEVLGTIEDSSRLIEQIQNFRDNDAVKGVVLRIDSPGGGVGPSQEIHAELLELAKAKPLVVSMGSVAASGGYYLAVAAERIFANPGSITGSIGVIMSFPNYQELMGKIGVANQVVKSGRFKDIGSSTRSFTEDDRELLQGMIDDVHSQFIEAVSEGRSIPVERLQPYVDGRIFSGRQAKDVGLVDELGGLTEAIRYTGKLAGLGENPDLIYPPEEQKDYLQRLLQGVASRFLGVHLSPGFSIGPQYLWGGFN